MDFYNLMKQTQDNVSFTENGMRGYKTTYNPIVDINFKVASYRHETDEVLVKDFYSILNSDNADHALRFLFYVRDARAGLGERRLFKKWLEALVKTSFKNKDEIVNKIVTKWIPFYGRYDDMFVLMGTEYEDLVVEFVRNQLREDFINMKNGKPISLLAKWMPSENASNTETIKMARTLANKLGSSAVEYRKTLSLLRKHLKVLETYLSSNEWSKVNYNAVPSKANLKYKNAFLRHDEERRRDYLAKLRLGDSSVKMNGGVNFPHEIVHKYCDFNFWGCNLRNYDEALEQLWKNLKSTEGLKNTIVVRDGSGSMTTHIGDGDTSALDVSTALAIYCAEHLQGNFKNKFITFSSKTEIVDLSECSNLHNKLRATLKHSDCSNTNIAEVFNTILKTAVDHKLSPDEVPSNILIISDMEFDGWNDFNADSNVFNNASQAFERAGYKLPKLIFWNVNSRTNTIPCKENENGVILVSGFSQNVLGLVMSGKTDPKDALYDLLDKKYAELPLLEMSVSTTQFNKVKHKNFTPNFLGDII